MAWMKTRWGALGQFIHLIHAISDKAAFLITSIQGVSLLPLGIFMKLSKISHQ
jgi:hypothetical protein